MVNAAHRRRPVTAPRRRHSSGAALLVAAALTLAIPARAAECGLELVLAMDVSRSVVKAEFELQMGGLALAFRDPEVAEAVRNLMFTFSDISKLTDRELQILLREVDQKDLVIALKAADEELKDKILGNMSERVRTFISEEMEFLGPMRLSEVEEVQLRIVQQVRQLEEQGQVTIVRGEADDTFV